MVSLYSMNILDFFQNRSEKGESSTIGQVETTSESLSNMAVGLMQSMGMTNPSTLKAYAGKAITITKKGEKYLITLNAFKPPVTIEWTNTMDINQLAGLLLNLANTNKKVGYVNFLTQNGRRMFQIAIG